MKKIYKLDYNSDTWGHIDYVKDQRGASHIPFNGENDIYFNMVGINNFESPKNLYFGADFSIIPQIDYPKNSLHLNIFSKKMFNILNDLGNFKHNLIPVVFFNHKELEAYHIEEGIGLEDLKEKNDNYVALQLLEYTDAFDKEKSEYEEHFLNPDKVGDIDKLVLKEPKSGFPPIFKIKEGIIRDIFITEQAKNALEEAGIKGCEYEEVEVSS